MFCSNLIVSQKHFFSFVDTHSDNMFAPLLQPTLRVLSEKPLAYPWGYVYSRLRFYGLEGLVIESSIQLGCIRHYVSVGSFTMQLITNGATIISH